MKSGNENINQYVIGLRSYLSIQHLNSSWLLSQRANQIERNYSEVDLNKIFLDHRSSVLGSIILIVSFLESHINEFYSDISDNMLYNYTGIDTDAAALIKKLWERGIPRTARYAILDKYEIALDILTDENFDKNKPPYQDVKLLIRLRNSLVHYESEWVFQNKKRLHKHEKDLTGKFALNPITGKGNHFFPDKCLGYGCTQWAIQNALDFVLIFYNQCSVLPHNMDNLKIISEKIKN